MGEETGGCETTDSSPVQPSQGLAMSKHKEIFLSYGREVEVIYFVKRLKQDLEQNG